MPKSKHYDEFLKLIEEAELFEGMKENEVVGIKEKYAEMPDEVVLDAIEYTKKANEDFVEMREKNDEELNKATENMALANTAAERFLKREELEEKNIESQKADESELKEIEGDIQNL